MVVPLDAVFAIAVWLKTSRRVHPWVEVTERVNTPSPTAEVSTDPPSITNRILLIFGLRQPRVKSQRREREREREALPQGIAGAVPSPSIHKEGDLQVVWLRIINGKEVHISRAIQGILERLHSGCIGIIEIDWVDGGYQISGGIDL